MKNKLIQQGFSTIELLIAFSIAIIFIGSSMMVVFGGQSAGLNTKLDSHSLTRITSQIGDATNKLAKQWSISPSPLADLNEDGYSSVYGIRTNDDLSLGEGDCAKIVTSKIGWFAENNISRANLATEFKTIVSDIESAKKSEFCDPTPTTEWENPDTLGFFDPSGIASNGSQATAIKAISRDDRTYVFVSSNHSSKDEPDFWILDATDAINPSHESNLDINNGIQWGGGQREGINDFVVVGDYVYALRNYKNNQLQVINISSLNAPSQGNVVSFATAPINVLETGTDPQGNVMEYYDGRLYVGLKTTDGPEFLVFDITANPAQPAVIGILNEAFNHSVNDIRIHNGYAYLALGYSSGEVAVINLAGINTGSVTNIPLSSVTYLNLPFSEAAVSLNISENTLFIGRAGKINQDDFYAYAINAPTSFTLKDSARALSANNTSIQDILIRGNLAFLATSHSNKEFQVWNISDPTNIQTHFCNTFNFPAEAVRLVYSDNKIFTAVKSNNFMRVIFDEPNDASCN